MKKLRFLVALLFASFVVAAAAAVTSFPTPTNFGTYGAQGVTVFPDQAQAVTTSDTDTFERPVMIYVGTTGDVAVTTQNGANVTFVAVPAGSFVPVKVKAVKATGTTAGDLVAVY